MFHILESLKVREPHSRWTNTKRPNKMRTAYCGHTHTAEVRNPNVNSNRQTTLSSSEELNTHFELGVVVHENGHNPNVWHKPEGDRYSECN